MSYSNPAATIRRSHRLGAAKMWAHLCPALTVDAAVVALDDIAAARAASIGRLGRAEFRATGSRPCPSGFLRRGAARMD